MTYMLLILALGALVLAFGAPLSSAHNKNAAKITANDDDPPVDMTPLQRRSDTRSAPDQLGRVWLEQIDGMLWLEAEENAGAIYTLQVEVETRDSQLGLSSRDFHVLFLQAPQDIDLVMEFSRPDAYFDPTALQQLGVRKLLSKQVGKVQARPVARTGKVNVLDTRSDLPELISDVPIEHLKLHLVQEGQDLRIDHLRILEDFNQSVSQDTDLHQAEVAPLDLEAYSISVFSGHGIGAPASAGLGA